MKKGFKEAHLEYTSRDFAADSVKGISWQQFRVRKVFNSSISNQSVKLARAPHVVEVQTM